MFLIQIDILNPQLRRGYLTTGAA